MQFNEEFLHYLWKFRLFTFPLSTTAGEYITVIHPGELNTDAGPDFFNARITIGNTTWAGNIEIHMQSSDWLKHGHQHDNAYQSTILHIVYNDDISVKNSFGNCIPTLEVKHRIAPALFENYQDLMMSRSEIACGKHIAQTKAIVLTNWLEKLSATRLEKKVTILQQSFEQNKNNWEETFYQALAKNFGIGVNTLPFEMLAKSLPVKCLAKHKDNLFQIEAMLFGQAGFFEKNYNDNYPKQLQKEYRFLSEKFALQPLGLHLWRFLRIRPDNFPTLRIAQFAALVHQSSALFSKITTIESIHEIISLFDVHCSDYWNTHYIFDKCAAYRTKSFGKNAIILLIINTVIPFLFLYGKATGNQNLAEKAFQMLEQLPPEKNSITKEFENLGVKINSALQSQALLELKICFCKQKKCLDCNIGNFLLQREQEL
ncbi:MAG: DUF2851 family protein [Lentimicrobiaceae bacterium]|nr:DUF2851 family protein [Lentimicrobiaceae bacterium]